jgi:YggT family protein
MRGLFLAIDLALEYYVWFLLAVAVYSWMIDFRFIDPRRRAVTIIDTFFRTASGPVRRPIQKTLPNLGGIDISPILALIVVVAVRYVIKLFILPHL